MTSDTPRIASVTAYADGQHRRVSVKWSSHAAPQDIELAGWIATGGETLAPLSDPKMFLTAHVVEHGRAVAWGWHKEDHDDLTIDAVHLDLLAALQGPFDRGHLIAWQQDSGLSNQEAADFLRVSLSTYNAYKAGGSIPPGTGMICRAAKRDPLFMQAYYTPRKAGRPRKAAF